MRVTGSDKRDKVSSQLIVQCCAWVMHEILPDTYLRAALLISVWSVSFFFFFFHSTGKTRGNEHVSPFSSQICFVFNF